MPSSFKISVFNIAFLTPISYVFEFMFISSYYLTWSKNETRKQDEKEEKNVEKLLLFFKKHFYFITSNALVQSSQLFYWSDYRYAFLENV